jgi:hypothetical protein
MRASRSRAGLLLGTAALLLAGCSSRGAAVSLPGVPVRPSVASTPSPSTPTPGSEVLAPSRSPIAPVATRPAVLLACTAEDVTVTLGASESGAGSTHTDVDVRSSGRQACTLHGAPRLLLHAGPSGVAAVTDRSVPAETVVLAPGAVAHATLMTSDAGKYDPATCHPQTTTHLRVDLPGQATGPDLAYAARVCASAEGRPSVLPFSAGP